MRGSKVPHSNLPSSLPTLFTAVSILFSLAGGAASYQLDRDVSLESVVVEEGFKNESRRVVGNHYRTVSSQDDEVHDEEIMEAVRNSLRLWKEGKANKTHRNRVKRDEEVVCYGTELGCFRDEGPFDYLDMLPSSPDEVGTKYLLYTKDNEPEVYSYFNYTKLRLNTSNFNSSQPTKIVIHGFGSTCMRMWANEMRTALLSVVECNVICVDWENGAALPNYVRAAVNTRLVGKQLSLFIRWLATEYKGRISYRDFHLIGFSLGAHVAGFSGQEIKNISRITGLDPAGPLFENYDKRVRLDSSDALFVDVIHSNGDSLLMGGLGSWEPIGHVDFYPNGGRVQKGCSNLFLGAFRDFIWSSPTNTKESSGVHGGGNEIRNGKSLPVVENDGRSLCNHRRAYKFFTESVSPRCPYPSFSCDSYDKFLTGACFQWDHQLIHSAHMGYYADQHQANYQHLRLAKQLNPSPPPSSPPKLTNSPTNFYLMTRDDEPFCANQYKLILESSPPLGIPVSTYGGVEVIIVNAKDDFNETFLLTQTHKDNMISGSILQKMIVAHPAITDPSKLILKYTAYKGWIYSGISRWSLDRFVITNGFGVSYSFCTRGLLLPSGMSVTITLTKGICKVTNYPFRTPFIHPNPPHNHHQNNNNIIVNSNPINNPINSSPVHYQGPHQLHVLGGGESSERGEGNNNIKNKNNDDRESGGSGDDGNKMLMDWSNDWQPMIMNLTTGSPGGRDGAGESGGCRNCSVGSGGGVCLNCSGGALEGEPMNNEIDSERSGRGLRPLHLLPLSRAIEPRPVRLRSARLSPTFHPHPSPQLPQHHNP